MGSGQNHNQMFALRSTPPVEMDIAGSLYTLVRVFKHDYWAATCLYESDSTDCEFAKVVVKFGREQTFGGLPMDAVGKWLIDREEAMYARLDCIDGIPKWIARINPRCCAIEFIEGSPLDYYKGEELPAGFFDDLLEIIRKVHAKDVAYVDSNKRSNILVKPDGKPSLIDFQISLSRQPKWIFPFRGLLDRIIDYFQTKDIYHICKHKRRMTPDELTPEENAISRRRGGLHGLHRRLTKPYRALRRGYLEKKHLAGNLTSPTADLEDHYQPEKETWRNQKP